MLKVMRERKLSDIELFKMVDIDGNDLLLLNELDEVVSALSDFSKKEILSIHSYFDIDADGEISKKEFLERFEAVNNKYDSYL